MAPKIGLPCLSLMNVVDKMQADAFGDNTKMGMVKKMEFAQVSGLSVGMTSTLLGAGALVAGVATAPIIATTLAVGVVAVSAAYVAKLVESYARGYHDRFSSANLETQEARHKLMGTQAPQEARALSDKTILSNDEIVLANDLKFGYVNQNNSGAIIAQLTANFTRDYGRPPEVNWLKVGIAANDSKMVEKFAPQYGSEAIKDAISFAMLRNGQYGVGNPSMLRALATEEVKTSQAQKLAGMNPDSVYYKGQASTLDFLKEKFAGFFRQNQDVNKAMKSIELGMSQLETQKSQSSPSTETIQSINVESSNLASSVINLMKTKFQAASTENFMEKNKALFAPEKPEPVLEKWVENNETTEMDKELEGPVHEYARMR